MRTILGAVMAIGLCLVIFCWDASPRGFGGFRGDFGGFRGAYGGFDGGDRERAFRAGEDYSARRRAIDAGAYYSGGWGIDESDDEMYDNGNGDDDDDGQ